MDKMKSAMYDNKTSSKIPKTARQKKMWIEARKIVAKESGKYSEKNLPWGLVTHIEQNEVKANKIAKPKDWKDAKKSKAVSKYTNNRKTSNERKEKKR